MYQIQYLDIAGRGLWIKVRNINKFPMTYGDLEAMLGKKKLRGKYRIVIQLPSGRLKLESPDMVFFVTKFGRIKVIYPREE